MFAYLLGDLDDFHFPHCQWAADYHERARIEEVILIYSGLKISVVQAFGVGESFSGLIEELVDLLPSEFYGHYQKTYHDNFLKQFNEKPLGDFVKMKLADNSKIKTDSDSNIKRLDDTNIKQLNQFYKQAYPECYFDERMLKSNLYFGFFKNNEIISVAGVHIDSKEYGVTALGNIATHPEHRGQGLATKVTSRLLNEIINKRDVITLNVKVKNTVAIKCYEDLGFVKTHDYCEGYFTRK